MSVERRRGRRSSADNWSPDRHRVISGAEVLEAAAGPRRAGSRPRATCSMTARPTTRDSCSPCSGRPSASARSVPTASRSRSWSSEHGQRNAGCALATAPSGEELVVRATHVVNATGVWADRLRPEELHDEAEVPQIRPSRGTHIIFADADLPLRAGAIVPAGGGRTIFALPWLGHTLVGTTDNDYEGELEHVTPGRGGHRLPAATRSTSSSGTALGRGHIAGAFAGVRPLISSTDSKSSVDISRKAELYETSSGMVTITGGKLTTWRRMAKMTVDRIVERDARDAPCRTHEIPLGQAIEPRRAGARRRGRRGGATAALAARYGHAARSTCSRSPPSARRWRAPIVEGLPDLLAEVVHAARREQARGIGDVLLRRTRLGLLAARRGHRSATPSSASPTCSRRSSAGTPRAAPREIDTLPGRGRGRGDRRGSGGGVSGAERSAAQRSPSRRRSPRPRAGAPRAARAAASIDGPSAAIVSLGGVALAQDGGRRGRLPQDRRRRRPRVRVRSSAAGAWGAPGPARWRRRPAASARGGRRPQRRARRRRLDRRRDALRRGTRRRAGGRSARRRPIAAATGDAGARDGGQRHRLRRLPGARRRRGEHRRRAPRPHLDEPSRVLSGALTLRPARSRRAAVGRASPSPPTRRRSSRGRRRAADGRSHVFVRRVSRCRAEPGRSTTRPVSAGAGRRRRRQPGGGHRL